MQLEPYLFFAGRCEEALQFYARVFGGEVSGLQRFGDAPQGAMGGDPSKVMHANFRAPGVAFMASDGGEERAGGGRVDLSIGSEDAEEGRRIFEALAEGGEVRVPYEKQFWGSSFGMLTDRYGIGWMVNAG